MAKGAAARRKDIKVGEQAIDKGEIPRHLSGQGDLLLTKGYILHDARAERPKLS